MTHILEDWTHKMEGQPPKKEVIWVLGIHPNSQILHLQENFPSFKGLHRVCHCWHFVETCSERHLIAVAWS